MTTTHYMTTAEVDFEGLTPVMRQVVEAKRKYPDTLLFFRLGDFYELFFEDALVAAPMLDMVLTSRNKSAARPIPMCGFPYHAMAGYVQRALEEGQRVALCEQLEDATKSKGPVKRGVTRVITPGVVLETEALDGRRSNNLVSLVPAADGGVGVAVADVSTGDFRVAHVQHAAALSVLLVRLEPKEIAAPASLKPLIEGLPQARSIALTVREIPADIRRQHKADAVAMVVAYVREYLAEIRPSSLGLLAAPADLEVAAHMAIGREAAVHLELLSTVVHGRSRGSLLHAVDRCCTAAGGRLLRSLLLAPLADKDAVEQRHLAVEALLINSQVRSRIREISSSLCDLARVASRSVGGLVSPRELAMARDTLAQLPTLRKLLSELEQVPLVSTMFTDLDGAQELSDRLDRTLCDEPGNQLAEGGVIRPGFCDQLDSFVAMCQDSKSWLKRYEAEQRETTGLERLRIRYSRTSGHGLEISRAKSDLVPETYRRIQTLKHVERYTTPELLEFESGLTHAEAHRLGRETELYNELVEEMAACSALIRGIATALAELDVHAAFAHLADEHGYVRPRLSDASTLELLECRHPVVEQMLTPGSFVSNDIRLGGDGNRILLLTGPNMAGKSTLMRQVALCGILSQAGGFVPAREALLPIFDAMMTRIGAADDISEGASTFMVEMREASLILQRATARTLVLLDEIGRGTSTQDGLAIAWSVIESLHDDVGALCLFATHYHELTHLEERLPHLHNMHVAVREWGDEIVFVHTLQEGPTNRSHGIAVARLAGIPEPVIERARDVLEDLMRRSRDAADASDSDGRVRRQLSFFDPRPEPLRQGSELQKLADELASVDVDGLSPRQAHEVLASLTERARTQRDES